MTPDPLELLTVAEVAGLMKRPRVFVLGLIREGKLPVVRLGDGPFRPHARGRKDYRVARKAVESFIDARTVRKAPTAAAVGRPGRKPSPSGPIPMPSSWNIWDGVDRGAGAKRRASTNGGIETGGGRA